MRAWPTAAIDGFTALDYPYWRAASQTDLALWLNEHEPDVDPAPLFEQATETFVRLKADPALARVRQRQTVSGPLP